jgi:DNA sulfur modification protein DndE
MPIESVRISKTGKDQLATLKRRTKIPTWNILCRWAFCVSLQEPTPPHAHRSESEYPIEMTWKTFAGEYEGLYWALLVERCRKDGVSLDNESLATQLRLHVHRGISYLAGNKELQSVSGLVGLVT